MVYKGYLRFQNGLQRYFEIKDIIVSTDGIFTKPSVLVLTLTAAGPCQLNETLVVSRCQDIRASLAIKRPRHILHRSATMIEESHPELGVRSSTAKPHLKLQGFTQSMKKFEFLYFFWQPEILCKRIPDLQSSIFIVPEARGHANSSTS